MLPHKAKLPHVEVFRSWLRSQVAAISSIERLVSLGREAGGLRVVRSE
jgi:hypothetical protein